MRAIKRILKHAAHHGRAAKYALSARDIDQVERAILLVRLGRQGEIVVVIEDSLSGKRLARGTTAAQRAVEIFAKHMVWDTEGNEGILIYVLMADRHVSVLADRGLKANVDPKLWSNAVKTIETSFRKGDFAAGLMAGVATIQQGMPDRASEPPPPGIMPRVRLV